ncbi:MAG: redoxin family protein [Planctomycetota bacterium]|jgi:peroxiredoxin
MADNRIQVGDRVPDVILRTLTDEGPVEIESAKFFRGRKVVLFAVPGAYTPTCNKHLPTFVEHADAIKAKGVAEIACLAVNDPFVMDAWSRSHEALHKVTMLSDGNAEFSEALGLTFDGTGFGLGIRSLRYAMIVEDGTVTALEVEETPGVCAVSSGLAILEAL